MNIIKKISNYSLCYYDYERINPGWVICALMGFFGILMHTALNTLVSLLTESSDNLRGAIMGVNSAVTCIGLMSGSALMGLVYTRFGFVWVTASCALLMAAAALAAYTTRR